MIYRDWRFLMALGLTVLQQVLLAVSTYFIAQAGFTLEVGSVAEILRYVSLFFIFALSGYIVSSLSSFFSVRASNEAWREYVKNTLVASTQSMESASSKNKQAIAQWLAGEAAETLAYACSFYLGLASIGLNILLTLFVFYLSIGWQITIALAASLLVSLTFVMLLRRRIETLAGGIQQQKLNALMSVETTWTAAMFGSSIMRGNALRRLDRNMSGYFDVYNKYIALEQVVACCPIVISTVAVMILLEYSDVFTLAVVGSLVAILPRTLQVFGSVHSLSMYLSQFYMIRTKLRNLASFTSSLDIHRLQKTCMRGISVCASGTVEPVPPASLITQLLEETVSVGRFTVTGKNGSGKSSYLKMIRGVVGDSLLLTPETSFMAPGEKLSTGQARIKEIEALLVSPPTVVLLDEWDANLDDENRMRIDNVLKNASNRIVIVEVRHQRQVHVTDS